MKTSFFIIILLFSVSLFVGDSDKKIDTYLSNSCLPENQLNKSMVDETLTDPTWADIWVQHNITGVTPQSTQYVSSTDPKCTALVAKYNHWITETHPDSNLLMYTATFHKSGNYYFVVLILNQYPNMRVFGSSAFYILDQNLEFIEGLAI